MGINHFDRAALLVLSQSRVGGWVNDSDDPGKETYRDISRHYNPGWEGWRILDQYTKKDDYALMANEELQRMVHTFYMREHWEKHRLHEVEAFDICLAIFDTSILCGATIAPIWVQEVLNVLNDRAALWPETEVDGWIGPETVGILNQCGKIRHDPFLALYEAMRLNYHIKNSRFSPKLEKYITGWVNRCLENRGKV